MESWRRVWRDGFAPLYTLEQLEALLKGLKEDDSKLVQGATTSPPPLMCVQDWPCDACDVIGYPAWRADKLESVGQVEEFFARACYEADQKLGEPAACRWLLNYWDDTPRDVLFAEMAREVERAIASRSVAV